MTVTTELGNRGISEALHFTTQKGVVGVLASRELKSRFRLPNDSYLQHILHVNAANRPEASEYFDKKENWLDYVNLSISEINRSYFDFSQGWHKEGEIWWAILSFSATICDHPGVYFTTTNNSYAHCRRGTGIAGFESLFAPTIKRKNSWVAQRGARAPRLPTCQQAEILYPSAISTDWLQKIYVACGEHHDLVAGWLKEFGHSQVEVVISADKFTGQPN